jgi:hypothetical protein
MPDLDIVNPIAPGWHRPYKLVRGGAEPADVGRAALAALGRALRRGHGLRWLGDLQSVAEAVMGDTLSASDALSHLHAIELASGGERHTKVAVRTVEGIIAQAGDAPDSVHNLGDLIATRFCRDLLAHYLYGPAWIEVLQERFPVPSEARAFADAVAAVVEPRLEKLAEGLVRDPEATRLRAPAIRVESRRSTAELLEEAVVL